MKFPTPDDLPKSIKRTEVPKKDIMGHAADSMDVDQKRHYDARASIYDRQNEMPYRAERLRKFDEYYLGKLEKLLPPGGLNYLDFGCSTGTHTKQFLGGLRNNHIDEGYGIDISPKSVELAAQVLPEFKFIEGGAAEIDFEDKFDLMTSFFHVLGHLTESELELFFQNVSRSLKPGGILCFDVLKLALKTRLLKGGKRYATYMMFHPDDPDGSLVADDSGKPLIGSMGSFTKKQIVGLARKNSLEVVDLSTLKDYSGEFAVILKKNAGSSKPYSIGRK